MSDKFDNILEEPEREGPPIMEQSVKSWFELYATAINQADHYHEQISLLEIKNHVFFKDDVSDLVQAKSSLEYMRERSERISAGAYAAHLQSEGSPFDTSEQVSKRIEEAYSVGGLVSAFTDVSITLISVADKLRGHGLEEEHFLLGFVKLLRDDTSFRAVGLREEIIKGLSREEASGVMGSVEVAIAMTELFKEDLEEFRNSDKESLPSWMPHFGTINAIVEDRIAMEGPKEHLDEERLNRHVNTIMDALGPIYNRAQFHAVAGKNKPSRNITKYKGNSASLE